MNFNDILRELGFKPHPSNWKHFGVGFMFSILFFLMPRFEFEFNLWLSILIAVSASFLLGLAREIYDYVKKKNFDWLDLIMTTLGGVASTIITSILTLWL